MPLPYYVSPEQMMKDKAEYARKGISRGKAIVAIEYRDGILLVAENPSTLLHKISEIYDRIAFAGVGKYNEFENLRVAGVRHADVKGYSYSRGDVSAKSLANAYSQGLGNIFTQDIKPFEVEVLVCEVGEGDGGKNEIYHILYDGSRRGSISPPPSSSECGPSWSPRTRASPSATSRSRSSTVPRSVASSAASRPRCCTSCSPRAPERSTARFLRHAPSPATLRAT